VLTVFLFMYLFIQCTLPSLKYGAVPNIAIVLIIVGAAQAKSDSAVPLFVVGAIGFLAWVIWLTRHLCVTSGTRMTEKRAFWAARAAFEATDEDVLSAVEEQERLNVKMELHPLRHENAVLGSQGSMSSDDNGDSIARDEEAALVGTKPTNEPLCGRELTASTTRSAHALHLTYREKRSGTVVDCRAIAAPDVKYERLARALSILSDLAECTPMRTLDDTVLSFRFFVFSF
jgi:hypothetical protein